MADEYRRFEIIQDALHHEQEIFWTRFTGFATLHAGLFVIATATNVQAKPIAGIFMSLLGIVLAATWAEVQRLSLRYVDRWKPLYHTEREKLHLDIAGAKRVTPLGDIGAPPAPAMGTNQNEEGAQVDTPTPLDPRFSSTDLANFVPWAVGALWVALVLTIVISN